MKFEARGSVLILRGQEHVEFPFPIRRVVEASGCLVVLLDVPVGERLNENVFGVSPQGQIAWQVPPTKYVHDDSPYTELTIQAGEVWAYNWDGAARILDPATGAVVREAFLK